MQYDQPTTAADLQASLNSNTSLSATTAAAISALLSLDTVESVNVAGWDGVGAPSVPTGTTADVVTGVIPGVVGDTVVVNVPDSLSSAKAFVFNSDANLSVTFAAPAPVATFAAFAIAADEVTAVATPDLVVASGNGDDTLIFKGDQNLQVDGGDGNDVILTGNGNNTIIGGNGSDVIITGTGNDVVYGGAGNNTIITGAGDDQIFLAGTADTVDAGEGYDVVTLQGSREDYTYTVGNQFNVTLTGAQTAGISNAEFLAFDNNESVALVQNEAEAAALRLFQGVLGRDADQGGAQLWAAQADAGVSTTDIAQQFLSSGEYAKTSNEAFVTSLYQQLLERTDNIDETGVDGWLNVLAAGGSRTDVAAAIATSQEAINLDQSNAAYVNGLYQAAFGRDAEATGLNGWVTQLVDGASRAEVASSILTSAEAGQKATSDFIDNLYSNALGRDANDDLVGKAGWVDYIAQGHSLAEVAVGIVGSAEATSTIDNVIVIHGQV